MANEFFFLILIKYMVVTERMHTLAEMSMTVTFIGRKM